MEGILCYDGATSFSVVHISFIVKFIALFISIHTLTKLF